MSIAAGRVLRPAGKQARDLIDPPSGSGSAMNLEYSRAGKSLLHCRSFVRPLAVDHRMHVPNGWYGGIEGAQHGAKRGAATKTGARGRSQFPPPARVRRHVSARSRSFPPGAGALRGSAASRRGHGGGAACHGSRWRCPGSNVARRLPLDRSRRREAPDQVYFGLCHQLHDSPRPGRVRYDIAALTFGKQSVEAGQTGDHRQAIARQVAAEVLQLVRSCAANLDLAYETGRSGLMGQRQDTRWREFDSRGAESAESPEWSGAPPCRRRHSHQGCP